MNPSKGLPHDLVETVYILLTCNYLHCIYSRIISRPKNSCTGDLRPPNGTITTKPSAMLLETGKIDKKKPKKPPKKRTKPEDGRH